VRSPALAQRSACALSHGRAAADVVVAPWWQPRRTGCRRAPLTQKGQASADLEFRPDQRPKQNDVRPRQTRVVEVRTRNICRIAHKRIREQGVRSSVAVAVVVTGIQVAVVVAMVVVVATMVAAVIPVSIEWPRSRS
jgi:hypothetical protein